MHTLVPRETFVGSGQNLGLLCREQPANKNEHFCHLLLDEGFDQDAELPLGGIQMFQRPEWQSLLQVSQLKS